MPGICDAVEFGNSFGSSFLTSSECFRNANDISTIAVSFVPVWATSQLRLSVAFSDNRKAFGVLVMFRVYHTVLLFAIRQVMSLYEEYASFIANLPTCNFVGERQALAFLVRFFDEIPPVDVNINALVFFVKKN